MSKKISPIHEYTNFIDDNTFEACTEEEFKKFHHCRHKQQDAKMAIGKNGSRTFYCMRCMENNVEVEASMHNMYGW